MTSAPAIGFEVRPSRWLARGRLAIATLALIAIALCGVALALKLLLAAGVLALLWYDRRRAAQSQVVAAGLSPDQGWSLRYADGTDVAATLVSFRVMGAFVLLHLTTPGRRRETLLLGNDNSDADIRRRLRMRLAAP